MVFIITALHSEAKPLTQYFRLKQHPHSSKWRVYRSKDVVLIITGTGKVASAVASTFLYCTESQQTLANSVTLNFGICGAVDKDIFSTGQLVLINKIVDHGSGRSYFPDMLLRHDLQESGLETFDRPVTDTKVVSESFVDMEAAGFFEAASVFFSPDRIFCLKLISDFLDGEKITSASIVNQVSSRMEDIGRMIGNTRKVRCHQQAALSEEDEKFLLELGTRLRFSVVQRQKLHKMAEGHTIRGAPNLNPLRGFLSRQVNSKRDAGKVFREIESILSTET